MGIETTFTKAKKVSLFRIICGSLLIAGTTIGAGMLGIPLLTAGAGFWPAVAITFLVWIFMLCTGLLFLEVALWLPEGSNILSMAGRFLGPQGKYIAGGMFLFLYYSLLIAYFAGGAPLLSHFFGSLLGFPIEGVSSYLFFGVLFGTVVAFGAKCIDRVNAILTVALVVSYASIVGIGAPEVQVERLQVSNWPSLLGAIPILFSAFGFHNVVPSLTTYFNKERKPLQLSLFFGTTLALLVYLLWQWLVLGSASQETIAETLSKGMPATYALQSATGSGALFLAGKYFAFFAIATSLLGVAFSMVDFLADGLKTSRQGCKRIFLTLLTFTPPFLFAALDPTIFDRALGIAGGFGEAFLNGLLPVILVWIGRYVHKNTSASALPGGKPLLAVLFGASIFVMGLEAYYVIRGFF